MNPAISAYSDTTFVDSSAGASFVRLGNAGRAPLLGHDPSDRLGLSPRILARRSAQVYAETASADASTADKLTVFRDRFAEGAEFRGPIFGHLSGRQVFGKLTFEHSDGADIRYAPVNQDDIRAMSAAEIARIDPRASGEQWHAATLRWTADYALGENPIHNEVTTTLAMDESGKIRRHTDSFDWRKWMDQALPGVPKVIRHSNVFRKLANFGLGVFTYFKG